MIDTGIPFFDWVLTMLAGLTAIAIAAGGLIMAIRAWTDRQRVPAVAGADGPDATAGFGRRDGDVHIESIREKQADHGTRIAVLENDQENVDDTLKRLDQTIVAHRKEQRHDTRDLHGKLDTIILRLPAPPDGGG